MLLSLVIMFFVSCTKKQHNSFENLDSVEGGSFSVDTVQVGGIYSTYVNYENLEHDKFNKNLFQEKKLRSIIVHLVTDSIPLTESEILNNVHRDTVFSHDPHLLRIEDISFSKKGEYYISGLIEDRIFIDQAKDDYSKTKVSLAIFYRKVVVKN